MEGTNSAESKSLARSLTDLRKGQGLTKAKLISSNNPALHLTVVDRMVDGHDSGTTRATAALALIHHFLHALRNDRKFRALASAFNLDISQPWNGQPQRLSDRQLMARRQEFADAEGISEEGGKPMLTWENESCLTLATELLSYTTPPINLDGSPWTEPDRLDGPETEPQATSSQAADTPAAPAEATNAAESTSSPTPAAKAVTAAKTGSKRAWNQATTDPDERTAGPPERQRRASRQRSSSRWLPAAAALVLGLGIGGGAMFYFAGGGDSDSPTDEVATVGEPTPTAEVATADDDTDEVAGIVETPAAVSDTDVAAVEADEPTTLPEPTLEPTLVPATATPLPEPTATPEPTPTVEPTATAEPTPRQEPTAVPLANVVLGFDLPISNLGIPEERLADPQPINLGGVEFDQSVNYGTNGTGTWRRSDLYFIEFPTSRQFQCFDVTLGLADQSSGDQSATFIVTLDGEVYEERVLTKFDLWLLHLDQLADTGFVEISWQFPNTEQKGFGVVADPLFFRECE